MSWQLNRRIFIETQTITHHLLYLSVWLFKRIVLSLWLEVEFSKTMIDNNIAFSSKDRLYSCPEVCVIGLNNQDVICQASPVDGEMREGDDNW